ncbi:hypothetical protein BVRB_3g053270 [Beta vulgaris subsp. vulgaris]|nr:hypothetical protein BVRB_3g053270 [Beta vulgaris subsp. vulgaris]
MLRPQKTLVNIQSFLYNRIIIGELRALQQVWHQFSYFCFENLLYTHKDTGENLRKPRLIVSPIANWNELTKCGGPRQLRLHQLYIYLITYHIKCPLYHQICPCQNQCRRMRAVFSVTKKENKKTQNYDTKNSNVKYT